MAYADRPFVRTREQFDDLFNSPTYQSANQCGSVKNYFINNSYGKFTPEFTVVGPYTSTHNMAYYRDRSGDLLREAVANAIKDISFDEFDNTKNGFVDAVTIIFAGQGRESGGGNNAI
jgi:M6 family metalloprotease-like protein